jgi:hypothetical protein
LFPDQTHLISRVERLTAPDGRTNAIYFESRPANEKGGPQFSLYLTKPDGASPVEVLKDINHVVSRRISGDVVHFIYQKGLVIKESTVSIKSFSVVNDILVATMVKVD